MTVTCFVDFLSSHISARDMLKLFETVNESVLLTIHVGLHYFIYTVFQKTSTFLFFK